MPIDFDKARHAMVEQQVRPWEVLDPRVLDVLAAVNREDFVAPRHRKMAYADLALPLEHGEVMLKPVIEGRLLQALDLDEHEEVLEIGTGSGYLSTCLAKLTRAVVSIDIHDDFVERARGRAEQLGLGNLRIAQADALCYEPGRQFDTVVVSAAVTEIPSRFREWLRPGGRLFVVRGQSPVMEAVLVTRTDEERWQEESLFETDIPYLHGAAPVARFVL